MDKKQLIIQEIEKWRSSRLLPEQYCDFLLNLYQDKEEVRSSGLSRPIREWNLNSPKAKSWIIFCVIFTFISFISFYFNAFSLPLQIGSSLLVLVVLYFLGYWLREKNIIAAYLAFGTGSVFLLFIGPYLLRLHGWGQSWIIAYVVLCSVLWILLGWSARLAVFQLCGWIGLMLFYGWVIHQRFSDGHWLQLQLFWLPLAVVFLWLGWLVHHLWKSSARVFMIMGTLLCFAAEVYMIFSLRPFDMMIQTVFIIKLLSAAVLLYVYRKKWMEWVG